MHFQPFLRNSIDPFPQIPAVPAGLFSFALTGNSSDALLMFAGLFSFFPFEALPQSAIEYSAIVSFLPQPISNSHCNLGRLFFAEFRSRALQDICSRFFHYRRRIDQLSCDFRFHFRNRARRRALDSRRGTSRRRMSLFLISL